MPLPALLVVTGTVQVEGGERSKLVREKVAGGKILSKQEREVTDDRKAANTIATGYMRRIRERMALRTPFGVLFHMKDFAELKAMIDRATQDVAKFNATSHDSKLLNAMCWEYLQGNRLALVEGWVAREQHAGNEEVIEAVKAIKTAAQP